MDYAIEAGRRQRKRQAMHQNLLDAGGRLFRQNGIARTTVEEIAEAVDVARQTFFNHFPYKEALCLEIGSESVRRVAERAHAMLEMGANSVDVLQRTAEWILESALEDAEVAVVVARELLHPDVQRANRAAQIVPLVDVLEAILLQAREEGSVRGDIPLDLVAGRLRDVLTGIVSRVLDCSAEQLQKELAVCFDIVFNGITDRSR